jgi:hypothetical protein
VTKAKILFEAAYRNSGVPLFYVLPHHWYGSISKVNALVWNVM